MAEKKQKIELPSELIILILSKLPNKSLLKFKCVSQKWYNWISDPCFIGRRFTKDHIFVEIRYHPSLANSYNLRFTVTDSQGEILQQFTKEGKTYKNMLVGHGIRHAHSCNSLICFDIELACSNWTFEHMFVCNLATRELILLPRGCYRELFLNISFGFGYLPSLDEYKVVRLYWDIVGKEINCEVLSLISRKVWAIDEHFRHSQWRTVANKCPRMDFRGAASGFETRNAIFANGCIYWLADSYQKSVELPKEHIVCFNLSSEEFRIHHIPEAACTPVWCIDMINFGGFLTLVNRSRSTWKLWSLQDHGSNCIWVNTHTIDMSNYMVDIENVVLNGFRIRIYMKRVVSDRLLVIIKYQNTGGQSCRTLLYYNTDNQEFRSIDVAFPGRIFAVSGTECLAKISI